MKDKGVAARRGLKPAVVETVAGFQEVWSKALARRSAATLRAIWQDKTETAYEAWMPDELARHNKVRTLNGKDLEQPYGCGRTMKDGKARPA